MSRKDSTLFARIVIVNTEQQRKVQQQVDIARRLIAQGLSQYCAMDSAAGLLQVKDGTRPRHYAEGTLLSNDRIWIGPTILPLFRF